MYAAIAMSRSVMMPIGLPSRSTTGTAPQSSSHMMRAAVLSGSFGPQLFGSRLINSDTSMDFLARFLGLSARFVQHLSNPGHHARKGADAPKLGRPSTSSAP